MQGKIQDVNGEPLIGANILAVHLPSGTTFGTATDVEGNYRIPNMRVGGPYKVTISYTGYGETVLDGIFLRLGETFRRDFSLEEQGIELAAVQVVARQGTTGTSSGASTQITSDDIDVVPTLNRDLADYVRLTPQATGYSGGTSFAGVNNRYNAIYIDGAVNNDVFGLSSQGTNGGQTGIAPFSIDIIDQFQVVLSPYDVTLGGFAGGGINAVTKSGTNNFEGTAYYFWQNESMVGKTNQTLTDRTGNDREGVAKFSQKTYGASLGGPIVKDKVFFFVNAELRRDETPSPFDFGVYDGDADQGQLNTLRDFLRNTYNYDPGTFGSVADELNGTSLFGKLDINLNQNHRLTLRHNYTKAENIDRNVSNSRFINFSNNGVFFPSTTNSSALELKSTFGTDFSNNLIIGFTAVRDDRDPIGSDFPYVYIEDGAGTIALGSEEFSTGNALDQDIFTITDNFKIYKGNHTITLGTHNEFYKIYNLFIRQNYGTYRFENIDAFLNGEPAIEYDRSYSLVDDLTGDGSAAASDFNAIQLGFYAQDEWTVNPRFTLTYGLRLDIPVITTDPAIHSSFNSETLPVLRQNYDVAKDVEGGVAPDGQLMISPRVGFDYDLAGDRSTILRGGIGIFTSRIPFVWPGAMFNNNGVTIGSVSERDIPGDINFIADIQKQYENPSFSVPSGQVDLFTKDFKYPQVLRGNLAVDTKLPGGIAATLEGVYTKTLNNVVYTNVNSDPTVDFNWTNTGGDNRPVFLREDLADPYGAGIYVGSNTSDGYTYTLTAALAKEFDFGLTASLSYTYGDAEAVNEGTSSQNSSQWRGQVSIDGRNFPVLGRSDFALGHRVLGALSYSVDWNAEKNATTTLSLLYEGLKGSPYSYVIGGSGGRNINNETGSTSRNRSLIWIPANQNEITLVETDGVSPQEQWNRLNAFIEDDPYLSKNRGSYAEKNSNWMPYVSYLDLSLRQDFGLKVGGKTQKLQFSWDVFNLANLLNSSWGVRYSVPGDFNNYFLYDFVGYADDGTTPQFSYTEEAVGKDALDISDFSSRWRMRLGLRYIFK
ncbi:MAG: TonB-dependent receptor [Lewinellaceae bacterium]|nr:TonB-dependent receptor [Lewinellaceae bacterium]